MLKIILLLLVCWRGLSQSACYFQNCDQCPISPLNCTGCNQYFFCCSLNCNNCGQDQCVSCETNYTLVDEFCVLNNASQDPNCFNVATNGSCLNCFEGFYYIEQVNQCFQCSESCLNCTNFTNCIECSYGSFLSEGMCWDCSMPDCITCFDNSYCLLCGNSSVLSSGICMACQYLINNCVSCVQTQKLTIQCDLCSSGYYLSLLDNNLTTCLMCPNYCSICNSSSCIQCTYGLFLENNTCLLCSVQNCETCTQFGSNCTQCMSGYYLNQSQCLPCGYGCSICQGTQCLQCIAQFSLDISCLPCPDNCEQCFEGSCSQCINNFIVSSIDGTCVSCDSLVDGCLVCSMIECDNCPNYFYNACYACNIGYYLNSTVNGSCIACTANCQYCTDSIDCLFCQQGYFLMNNQCLSCQIGCSSCSNSSICQICMPGYFINGSSCIPCLDNCNNCNSTVSCIACNTFSSLINNSCIHCSYLIPQCVFCVNQTCLNCSLGYYLVNFTLCQSCSSNCTACINGSICSACIESFYLLNQTCVSCFPCQYCLNTSYCLTCPSNSQIYNNLCPVCNNCLVCNFCFGCIYNTICYECQPGYSLTISNYCVAQNANSISWWFSLIIVVLGLIAIHLFGYLIIWLRNRSTGYLSQNQMIQLVQREQ